jgi:hypothetical protein
MDWNSIPENMNEVDAIMGVEETYEENSTVSEALRRIEQAKLYESLIRHDFFAPGSARPEIQDKVTSEIRAFILERLSQLVGILPESSKKSEINLPWSQDQVNALTSIADRLLTKSQETIQKPNPVVNRFNSPTEIIPTQRSAPTHQPTANKTSVQKKPVPQSNGIPPNTKIDPATGLPMSENGVVLYQGQVPNKKKASKKMPSQREMDQLNARQVQASQRNNTIGSQMLNAAIQSAQINNANIIEE